MKTLLLVPLALAALPMLRSGAPAAPAAPCLAEGWTIDPVHSSVLFRVKHANATNFYGMFKTIKGEFAFDAAKPEEGKVSVTIPVESVDTRNAQRDGHLRSGDFFDAKQYPDITFTGAKIAKKGDAFEVTGDLEMHGKKVSLTVPVTKTGEGEFRGKRLGLETTFTVKRSEFGMTVQQGLADEVQVTVAISATQKK